MTASRLDQLLVMLNEEPHDDFLRYAVAVEYSAAGNTPEAISRIESLIADKPDYLGAYYKLGALYEGAGDATNALRVYRAGESIAMKQGNTKTCNELRAAIILLE